MKKPKCSECGKKDKVVIVKYQRQWRGFECERCYRVVATIYETDEEGKKLKYNPYRLHNI